jgi:hypothetical protein
LYLTVAMVAVGSVPSAFGIVEDDGGTSLSCVHETVYEPFLRLILVTVTIEDSPPLTFILDSGATQSSINDPFLAQSLGLEIKNTGLARGVGSGAKLVAVANNVCIRSDGIEVLRAPLVVHDIGRRFVALTGREIDGFLGADLFHRYVVEINPLGHRLLLHDPETFEYRGDGFEVPLEVVDQRPVVQGTVVITEGKREIPVKLVADTGSSRFLSLIAKSRRRLKAPKESNPGVSMGVVGGSVVAVASTHRFQLGPLIAENIQTAWMDAFRVPAVRNIEDLNGILGNRWLIRFRVFFDYRGSRLILEPIVRSER